MGSGGIERQAGTTPTTYAEVQVEGETYEIRHLFKASEHCCSWLKRRFEGTGQSAPADREATEHSHAPGLSLPKEATINDRPRNASAAGVAGTSGKPNRLQQAMAKCGLTVPKLTKKVCEVLRRKQGSKTRVDRATVYRIINGETKNPTEAVWTAILELLHLPADETVDAMMPPADK